MHIKQHQKPWFNPPQPLNPNATIAVIGAGISGICTAYHLANAGFNITVFEKTNNVLSGASGNPVAILDPYISLGQSIEKTFYDQAYKYAVEFYKKSCLKAFEQCGLEKMAKTDAEQAKFNKIADNYPSDILTLKNQNLFFPQSGMLKPHLIAETLTNDFKLCLNTKIKELIFNNQYWTLISDDGNSIQCDAVIICNAYNIKKFTQTSHINLDQISGQITFLSSGNSLKNVICSDHYLTPPFNINNLEMHVCGATFDRDNSLELTMEAHEKNINNIPLKFNNPKILGGRRAVRAMSRDHLPLTGPAPIYDRYLHLYKDIHHGPLHMDFPNAEYHPNLFINVGLGARGFLTAPLLAKYLTSIISDHRLPINKNITHAIHPARYIIRKLTKK